MKYKIHITRVREDETTVDIEADGPREAEEKAQEMLQAGDLDTNSWPYPYEDFQFHCVARLDD